MLKSLPWPSARKSADDRGGDCEVARAWPIAFIVHKLDAGYFALRLYLFDVRRRDLRKLAFKLGYFVIGCVAAPFFFFPLEDIIVFVLQRLEAARAFVRGVELRGESK